ncbi:hypothetical protein E2C01_031773 [Portunus trituberculatus]|uniref:Uncharacterized protein n=1 Tax=Portunus trituberculatus TaxID=210409 RepID=A0A5B7EYJ8_PORTR|nr:hypothetical protein [Portunus trituberculatus]
MWQHRSGNTVREHWSGNNLQGPWKKCLNTVGNHKGWERYRDHEEWHAIDDHWYRLDGTTNMWHAKGATEA